MARAFHFSRPGYVPRPDGVTRKHLPACNASEQHIFEGTDWKERDIQRVNSDPRVSRKSDLRLPYSGQVVAGGFKFVLAVCLQTLDRNARNYRESQRCVREDTPSTSAWLCRCCSATSHSFQPEGRHHGR